MFFCWVIPLSLSIYVSTAAFSCMNFSGIQLILLLQSLHGVFKGSFRVCKSLALALFVGIFFLVGLSN